jgi:hypothetical protein
VPDETTPAPPRKKAKGTPLTPEQRAERIARFKATRCDRGKQEAERVAACLHNPMDNLGRFKRLEWEIIGLHLSDPKLDSPTLAKLIGYEPASVHRVLHRPHVQKIIAEIRAQQIAAMIRGDFGAQATLKAAQGKAAKKVVDTMEVDDPKLGFTAAESVLDRTGLGKSSAVQHHHVHEILRSFTADELDRYGRTGQAPERFADVFRQLALDVTPDT